jgi:hypothetical protein
VRTTIPALPPEYATARHFRKPFIRLVHEVPRDAVNGFDWSGTFVDSGLERDASVGSLLVQVVFVTPAHRNPPANAWLHQLHPDGRWLEIQRAYSPSWSASLKPTAGFAIALANQWIDEQAAQNEAEERG